MTVFDSHVPVEYVRSLLSTAAEQGCDVDGLLADMHISRADIDEGRFFSSVKYGQLYQRIMWLMQDECFGMMAGGKVRWGSFRLMCLTLIQTENLRQAIVRAGEFSEICRGFQIRSSLHYEDDDLVSVRMAGIEGLPEADFEQLMSQQNADRIRTSLAVWHRFHCWLIGQEIPLEAINFRFCCPESFRALAESYPAQVQFDQEYNGFNFHRRYLEERVIQNPQTLDEFIRMAPYHLVISDSTRSTLKSKVRTILSKDVSDSMPGAEQVASQLNLSVTTLRRHLQQEGTSFQKIKDECRLEAAIHYLGCRDLTNSVISERLGFDETSAFFRAFKKWTGLTPGEYRKQMAE
ncbi:AraC family transcriptional regulator [Pseudomaricurvus alkylphenolicus]|jgi:AraC-like DNA-binding protein|uniref:helix-turn-helix domain-containing protein n=1 Tax=Pseudomaricurvus alkylphenolicus TaxID=1306991 RepID=UPI00141EEF10|nr:AraC family transcriptional regulator [Pseudomaricurvus alkylphenolicus]NIB43710.1 AraC family transcriptional regulator [Pseudomaricurvus alkylphenolicus]